MLGFYNLFIYVNRFRTIKVKLNLPRCFSRSKNNINVCNIYIELIYFKINISFILNCCFSFSLITIMPKIIYSENLQKCLSK